MNEKKTNIADLQNKKSKGEKIFMLTAYDYPIARFADEAGVDAVLVSDALGMVGLGYETTTPVTMAEIIHHTKAVVRGAKHSLILATMPFLSYSFSLSESLKNAGKLIKEGGAGGVEVEGGSEILDTVKAIIDVGIPVMPHIGLTRQYQLRFGKFKVQGGNASAAGEILKLALALQKAGAFAILMECIPDRVARIITEILEIPTIGIGSGPYCDGQALVSQDMLGLFEPFLPRFAKRYLNLSEDIRKAFNDFKREVESGKFPALEHCFAIKDEEFEKFKALIEESK
ncbi:MAG: 3-methyl-2-oxobutanoate hydroxymethyltransferase [Spirochaetota bacterium]